MRTPSLRFSLHQAAVDAVNSKPAMPARMGRRERIEYRAALKQHYENALHTALEKLFPAFTWPNDYQRKIWRGILKRLHGQPSSVKPLFDKHNVMPALRPWAQQHGLI